MKYRFKSIGTAHHATARDDIPRHWTVSDIEGYLDIDAPYLAGLKDIEPGQRIAVLFCFHESPPFEPSFLIQTPRHRNQAKGVFSICSPRRPNPIGLSVLEVLKVSENRIFVRGMDMFDGTPILDVKPHIEVPQDCPSYG